MDAEEVRRLVRTKIREAGSCLGFARDNKVHRTAVQRFLSGEMPNPQPRILAAVGLQKIVTYEPATPDKTRRTP